MANTMHDLYKSNNDDSVRYILGKSGTRKLFVIGLNPSKASKERSDTTVTKVKRVAQSNKYDGFVMLNLYPLRSTNPTRLPCKKKDGSIEKNIAQIIKIAKTEKRPHFWAAWGQNISLRGYLLESLKDIFDVSKTIGVKWLHLGSLTKSGHPRHPSRLSYEWKLNQFDVAGYLTSFTREKRN